ncbi:unnamed protein product [Absidia cylindrospora]
MTIHPVQAIAASCPMNPDPPSRTGSSPQPYARPKGDAPNCISLGEPCRPKKGPKCCIENSGGGGFTFKRNLESSRGYCHERSNLRQYNCLSYALAGESCTSGIPCDTGSSCVKGKCRRRRRR